MHKTSFDQMTKFVDEYLNKDAKLDILDIGSIGGWNYKGLCVSPSWKYTGMDLKAGANVDVVSEDMYHYPFADCSFDVIISGQTLEHVEDIYAVAEEIVRILKPGGIVCVIAPCAWCEHKFPYDCWRFYPDGMRYLFVKRAGLSEIKIFYEHQDCVAILKKEEK